MCCPVPTWVRRESAATARSPSPGPRSRACAGRRRFLASPPCHLRVADGAQAQRGDDALHHQHAVALAHAHGEAVAGAEPEILLHCEIAVHDVVLGHESDDAFVSLDVIRLAVDEHRARGAAVGGLARERVQKRGLAGARRAHHRRHAPWGQFARHVAKNLLAGALEEQRQVHEGQLDRRPHLAHRVRLPCTVKFPLFHIAGLAAAERCLFSLNLSVRVRKHLGLRLRHQVQDGHSPRRPARPLTFPINGGKVDVRSWNRRVEVPHFTVHIRRGRDHWYVCPVCATILVDLCHRRNEPR